MWIGLLFPRLFRNVKCVARTIERYKFGILVSLALSSYGIYRGNSMCTNKKMAKRLKTGSDPMHKKKIYYCGFSFPLSRHINPKSISLKYSIDRPNVVKSIQKLLFESDPDNGKIGVVLGPRGSGKTRAVMQACSNAPGPKYVLYKEIYMNSEAAEQLAHAADMPLSRNIFDSIFNSLGLDSQSYYFPEDSVKAITYVLNKVARRSKQAFEKEDLKTLPCFVIDATELLAMDEPAILNALLRLAQYYVSAKKIRIVLVDSDGITLSKINESLKHPIVDIVEVEDLKDHDAEQYLIERTKMSSDLAKRLVALIGGRLLHLSCAVDAYQKSETNEDLQLVYDRIKEYLFIKVMAPINNVIISTAPVSELIIKCFGLWDFKPLFPSQLKDNLYNKGTDPTEVQKTIDVLVNANLLRYNAGGRLVLHSRLVETEIKAKYCKH